ncbi:hypothetical protein TNCV_1687911 [Trichonephila clavipes]|nr:hypothetical protein TNCV_1687911 [Trichonephila clavipes]
MIVNIRMVSGLIYCMDRVRLSERYPIPIDSDKRRSTVQNKITNSIQNAVSTPIRKASLITFIFQLLKIPKLQSETGPHTHARGWEDPPRLHHCPDPSQARRSIRSCHATRASPYLLPPTQLEKLRMNTPSRPSYWS